MKNIAILGSTGSIGNNGLEVARRFPDKFRVVALTTDSNIGVLCRQIKEFRPLYVCVRDEASALKLKKMPNVKFKLFTGTKGLEALMEERTIEKVLVAISGSAALPVLLKALDCQKQVALANKEALVMAGSLIMNKAARKKIKIVPVDSEQSAIWQCLESRDLSKLKNIYITASGGPFRKAKKKDLKNVSIKDVLNHPRWKMGKKISVDSANLMNKGLELIEAMFLFDVPCDKIKIVIHPQAIVHSMVEFIDGVVLAQLSATDMRIPIQYALTFPERLASPFPRIDFYKLNELQFSAPDFKRFPCLKLAYYAATELGTMPAVLNAANEACVNEFLSRRINFLAIPEIIERVINRHKNRLHPDLGEVLEADSWARHEAYNVIKELN